MLLVTESKTFINLKQLKFYNFDIDSINDIDYRLYIIFDEECSRGGIKTFANRKLLEEVRDNIIQAILDGQDRFIVR